jgi:hypothetical protein
MPAPKGHPPYKGCETGGRPTIYTDAYIEKMADEFKKWLLDEKHVWIKDFALDNDFDPDLFSIWAEKNEKFSGVYIQAKKRQESRLINGGLNSLYNSKIVQLVLSNCHGFTEKQETKISGDSINPLAFIYQNIDGKTKDLINDEEE